MSETIRPAQQPGTSPALRTARLSRRALGAGGIGALALGIAACGEGSQSGSSDGGGDWTPTKVEHRFGTTTVDAKPTRVVSVGLTEQDFLLALGVVPVGVTDWYGDQPHAVWPWATDRLDGAEPTVLTDSDGIQFAEIAKLEPDLIVGVNSGMEKADYEKLSKLAPTIAQPADESAYFGDWKGYLTMIGTALGKGEEADAIVQDITTKFAEAAAAHPAFAQSTVIFLQNAVYDGSFIASQDGLGTEFLTDLGLRIPADIDPFIREGEQAFIPTEQITVLNSADVLIWGTEADQDRVELEKVPGFTDLTAVADGRSIYTGGTLAGAIYFSSPLSLPYILDELVPSLATALE